MKDVAIIAYQQSDCVRDAGAQNEVEFIMPVVGAVMKQAGFENVQQIDFTCSGSCDYQQGAAFAFVLGVDSLGAVPPIKESHVEMDAAWALYESFCGLVLREMTLELRSFDGIGIFMSFLWLYNNLICNA